MNTFLEGISAVVQPCTLVIAVPTVALILVARRFAVAVVAASVAATAAMMWARASGHWTFASDGAAQILIAVVIVAGFVLVQRNTSGLAIVGGLGCGFVAGWLWQPCVGEALAEILNGAETESALSLARMIIYTTGALLPAALLAAAPHAWPSVRRYVYGQWPMRAGLGFGAVYATTVLSGRYDDLIGEFSRWSSA